MLVLGHESHDLNSIESRQRCFHKCHQKNAPGKVFSTDQFLIWKLNFFFFFYNIDKCCNAKSLIKEAICFLILPQE